MCSVAKSVPIGAIHRQFHAGLDPRPPGHEGSGVQNSPMQWYFHVQTHQQLQMQRVPHRSRLDCDREHPRLLTDSSEICIIDCPQGFHLFSHLGMSVKYFCCSHILTITRLLLSLCTWDITAQSVVWFQDQSVDWERDSCNRSDLTTAPLRRSFATWGFCIPFFCSLLSR